MGLGFGLAGIPYPFTFNPQRMALLMPLAEIVGVTPVKPKLSVDC